MAIILPLIAFVSIYIAAGIFAPTRTKKELLIIAFLLFSTFVVTDTESLSLIKTVSYWGILTSWLALTIALIAYIISHRNSAVLFISINRVALKTGFQKLSTVNKILVIVVAVLLTGIFAQALLYPPNNWDSMTYHMARIPSWLSHQSVAHYPTDIIRQLYQPPFAEYVIMHLCVLAKSDFPANTVQLFYLVGCLITLLAIIDLLQLPAFCKVLAVVLAVTIPEVTLQASGTQNDIVAAFFVITTYYYFLRIVKNGTSSDYIFLGLATGLGLLTKGTTYVYLSPVLLALGIVVIARIIKTRRWSPVGLSTLAGLIALTLNIGHFIRNYQISGSPLGITKVESRIYSNNEMNAGLLVSNLIKNAGLHTGVMFAKAPALFADSAIYKLHRWAGIDINNPAVNFRNSIYTTINLTTDEDGAPNPFHFLLILIAFGIIKWLAIKRKADGYAIVLAIIIFGEALLFSAYLKWQPWHTRLHVPLFIIGVVLICYAASKINWFRKMVYALTPVLLAYAILVVVHAERRPLSDKLAQSRFELHFTSNPTKYPEYAAINADTHKLQFHNIGLITGVDDWIYPLFSDCFSNRVNPVYLQVPNFSKNARQPIVNVDCIVSTTINQPFIDYNGKRYQNRTPKNQYISLYY